MSDYDPKAEALAMFYKQYRSDILNSIEAALRAAYEAGLKEAFDVGVKHGSVHALQVLIDDEIISSGRAREIANMTPEEQRRHWRDSHAAARGESDGE